MRSLFISVCSLLLLPSCVNIIYAAPATQSGSSLSITKKSSNGDGVEEHYQPLYDPMVAAPSTWTNAVNNIQKRQKPKKQKAAAGEGSNKTAAAGGKDKKKAAAGVKDKSKATQKQKPKKSAGGGSRGPQNRLCPIKRSGAKKSTPKKQATAKSESKTPAKKQNGTKKPNRRRGLQFQKRGGSEGEASEGSSGCPPSEILLEPNFSKDIDMGKSDIQDLGKGKYIGTGGLNSCTAIVIKSNSAALVAHVQPDKEEEATTDIKNKITAASAKFPVAQMKALFYTPRDASTSSKCSVEIAAMKAALTTKLGIQSSAIKTEFYNIKDSPNAVGTMVLVTPEGEIFLGDDWDHEIKL